MSTALFQRIFYGIILIFAVIVLNFLLIHAAPGDVVDVLMTEAGGGDPEIAERIRAEYGLDKPVHVQVISYLGKIITGDLGYSYFRDESVFDLLLSHLPPTLMLTLSALVLAVFFGTLMGIFAATRPQGLANHLVTVLSLIGYATPVFWMGMMLLLAFSLYIPIFPAYGLRSIPMPETMPAQILDYLHHLVLPMFTLSILFLAGYSRISRASMLDVLGADYIRTARAKGLPERVVFLKHALKNAALPIVTMAGIQLGHIFSGAVIIESLFSLPGVGPLLADSVQQHDYPVLMGVLLGTAVTVVAANILTDLVYRLLDPRVKGIT